MIGEILTWAGVGIAALFTYVLYRSAERTDLTSDSRKPRGTESHKKEKEAV